MIPYATPLEADHYLALEFDADVNGIVPWPVRRETVSLWPSLTPTTLVHHRDGRPPALVEVRPVAEVRADPNAARRFRASRAYARERAWTFTLVTERTWTKTYLANLRFLRPYLWREPGAEALREVDFALERLHEATPAQLLAYFPRTRRGELLPVIWWLVAARRAEVDFTRPLLMTSSMRSARR